MSRAFIKESEAADPRCPGCGGLGDPIGAKTLEAHSLPAERASLKGQTFYCAGSECRTAYFDAWGASIPRDRATGLCYPKDPEGLICPCFGITAAEVAADAREGRKDRIKILRQRAEGPEARCAERCPDGLSCLPRVLRLFRETFEAPRS